MPPNRMATPSLSISSRAAVWPLAGFELVVAADEFKHPAAEHAALGIDLVDRDREPAGDPLA